MFQLNSQQEAALLLALLSPCPRAIPELGKNSADDILSGFLAK